MQPQPREIVDNVIFNMPRDGELQCAAVAVMQAYVNGYKIKMENNNFSGGRANYTLKYRVLISDDDWAPFARAGLTLDIPPGGASKIAPCMYVDFQNANLMAHWDSGKHVAQIYAHMAGVTCGPLPVVRRVKPRLTNRRWVYLLTDKLDWRHLGAIQSAFLADQLIDADDVPSLKDDEITGIIGFASKTTYLAAAMGLAVVEFVPRERPRNWLSKFSSSLYRAVDTDPVDYRRASMMAVANLDKLIEEMKNVSG